MQTAIQPSIKTVETSCNWCGSTRHKLYTTGKEHEYDNTTDETFNVVQCEECGLIFLNPRPDVSELKTIYPINYYSYGQQKLKEAANPNSILHRLRYKGFQAKVQKSISLLPDRDSIKMLDIGCGDGHTLNIYREQAGKPVETHGVDFNTDAVRQAQAQGHHGYAGRFEEVELPTDYFDLVTATHVIEHVEDPKGFTQKVHQILRPGGIFWFETPNIGSLDARIFKSHHWGAYHFPRHWFFFDVGSIRKLAEMTGFEVEMIDFNPNAIFWFWTFHSMIVSTNPKLRKFADWLFPAIDFQRDTMANFLRICFFCGIDVIIKALTGQTSNMVVVFRKVI
jgi:2-polyprenyl-3-methyl-5-hydroxy-6-metoxy-1,4-benzoquinol methylase